MIYLFFILLFFLAMSSQLLTKSLSSFLYRVTHHEGISIRLFALIMLPGVILHELAHALMAYGLFVPVGKMEFMPIADGDHLKLGSVQVGKSDPIRRTLIGVAPVIVGIGMLFALLYFLLPKELVLSKEWMLQALLLLYAVFVISNTMFSSRRDLEGSIWVVVILVTIGAILFFLGFRIPEAVVSYFSSEQLQSLLYTGSIFLAVPLGINIAAIILIRGLFRIR